LPQKTSFLVVGDGGVYSYTIYQQQGQTRLSSNNDNIIIHNKDLVATSARNLEEENNHNFTVSYGDDDEMLPETLSSV
jgi:hypothetical protein